MHDINYFECSAYGCSCMNSKSVQSTVSLVMPTQTNTSSNILMYAQYALFRLTSQYILPLHCRGRSYVYICPSYGVRRSETPQHDGYRALVLLDAVTHLSGGRGLSHPWLENTEYCRSSSWDPCSLRLLVRCSLRLLVRVSYGRCSGSHEQI